MNSEQKKTLDHYKGLNVPAKWFIGDADSKGTIEIIALGDDWIWSIQIDIDGTAHTSEANGLYWETGITV